MALKWASSPVTSTRAPGIASRILRSISPVPTLPPRSAPAAWFRSDHCSNAGRRASTAAVSGNGDRHIEEVAQVAEGVERAIRIEVHVDGVARGGDRPGADVETAEADDVRLVEVVPDLEEGQAGVGLDAPVQPGRRGHARSVGRDQEARG